MILDKPAGLPVTPVRDGALSLENHLDSLRFGYRRWPMAVHRLDRDTSGCLLLARNPRAHKRFAAAFAEGRVVKDYLAVVEGVPDAAEGRIDMALAKISSREAGWRIVPDGRGKPAATGWRLLTEKDGRALIAFRPETGRTHQIRVHAASGLGLPIVGDPVYGRAAADGMLLHAWRLEVPRDPRPAAVAQAPVPARFGAFVEFEAVPARVPGEQCPALFRPCRGHGRPDHAPAQPPDILILDREVGRGSGPVPHSRERIDG